ncbi:hypothetical protein [Bacillus velezensis]|uniref:hypothetical protein n=1 Tax=Bacillus velezensis TaxID=492670 RepID=UPI001F289AC2|nr:hypothetical protein [Bacillus velezensis]UQX48273.1 hypothetical protein M5J22_09005 [Bacillus velezensis]
MSDKKLTEDKFDNRGSLSFCPLSAYIGNNVSVGHDALIYGPCYLGNHTFIGFKAIVYNAIIGKGSFVSYNAVITNGVRIAPNQFVLLVPTLIHKKKLTDSDE